MSRLFQRILLPLSLFFTYSSPAFSQNLSAYINLRNEFYVFEDSFSHQIDYLPPRDYKIGGNAIAFTDNSGIFKIYQYGSVAAPFKGVITEYSVSNDLLLIKTFGSLYAFDEGQLQLLTRFPGGFLMGDSIIGFIDYASRNLLAYANGFIHVIKEGTTQPAATLKAAGGNLLAYQTFDQQFCIYYHDSVYLQDSEYPLKVQAGDNVVAYLDQYQDGLQVFFKGVTKTIEEFNPRYFRVANDLIVYTTREGIFKIFWNGSVYTIGSYLPSYLLVKDNLVVYGDPVHYSYVFYNGKTYPLENFIPQNINAMRNTLVYYDMANHLKIFSKGILQEMPIDTYMSVSNDYDVVKMKLSAGRFRFFSNGKLY